MLIESYRSVVNRVEKTDKKHTIMNIYYPPSLSMSNTTDKINDTRTRTGFSMKTFLDQKLNITFPFKS